MYRGKTASSKKIGITRSKMNTKKKNNQKANID